jgi:hypothetical protein
LYIGTDDFALQLEHRIHRIRRHAVVDEIEWVGVRRRVPFDQFVFTSEGAVVHRFALAQAVQVFGPAGAVVRRQAAHQPPRLRPADAQNRLAGRHVAGIDEASVVVVPPGFLVDDLRVEIPVDAEQGGLKWGHDERDVSRNSSVEKVCGLA